MEIYLVRHTTPNIEKGICYGQSDIGITDSFTDEVKKIHELIPVSSITRVYSSPLQRCKLLAKTFDCPILYDSRLKELNFGKWELMPWDAINEDEISPWMDDFVMTKVPGGESYHMLKNRMLEFYNDLDLTSDDKVVIVTHAGPMRAMLSSIRKMDLKNSFNIKINYADVFDITQN